MAHVNVPVAALLDGSGSLGPLGVVGGLPDIYSYVNGLLNI